MIISKIIAEELDFYRFPNIPMTDKGVIKRFKLEGMDLHFIKNAIPRNPQSVVSITYAMTVENDGEYIYAISLEKEDLRVLSSMLGVSVKELQQDYGTKGFFGQEHVVMYGDGRREDIGPYSGAMDEESVLKYFLDAIYDSFDTIEDAVLV